MNVLTQFHKILVLLFACVNGVMLYLFLMKLPYGIDPFFISLQHWNELMPNIALMLALAGICVVAAILSTLRLSSDRKNALLYWRKQQFSHPAHNAFLNNRKQPFESRKLLKAHPQVKDSGFNPQTQIELWEKLHQRHSLKPVVQNTRIHWLMLRDLYLVATLFLVVFLIAWPLLGEIPFQFTALYLLVFGTQVLFLMLTAKRIGWKLIDNVLAVDLGMGEGESAG